METGVTLKLGTPTPSPPNPNIESSQENRHFLQQELVDDLFLPFVASGKKERTALHGARGQPEVEEHETNDALRRQMAPPPGARPGSGAWAATE